VNESFLIPKSGVNVMWSQIISVTLSKNFTKQGDIPMSLVIKRQNNSKNIFKK